MPLNAFTSNNNENSNNNSFDGSNNDFLPNKKIMNKNINKSRNENRAKISASVSADNVLVAPCEEINLSNKDDIINTVKLSIGENVVNLFESKKWQEKKEGYINLKRQLLFG